MCAADITTVNIDALHVPRRYIGNEHVCTNGMCLHVGTYICYVHS